LRVFNLSGRLRSVAHKEVIFVVLGEVYTRVTYRGPILIVT